MKTLRLKEEISKLKDVDIYSVLLFVLYKLREVPEYSTLSELSTGFSHTIRLEIVTLLPLTEKLISSIFVVFCFSSTFDTLFSFQGASLRLS